MKKTKKDHQNFFYPIILIKNLNKKKPILYLVYRQDELGEFKNSTSSSEDTLFKTLFL